MKLIRRGEASYPCIDRTTAIPFPTETIPIIMTEPMNSLLVFTKHWGFVGRQKIFPDDALPLIFAFLVDAQSICNIQRTCRTVVGRTLLERAFENVFDMGLKQEQSKTLISMWSKII